MSQKIKLPFLHRDPAWIDADIKPKVIDEILILLSLAHEYAVSFKLNEVDLYIHLVKENPEFNRETCEGFQYDAMGAARKYLKEHQVAM